MFFSFQKIFYQVSYFVEQQVTDTFALFNTNATHYDKDRPKIKTKSGKQVFH